MVTLVGVYKSVTSVDTQKVLWWYEAMERIAALLEPELASSANWLVRCVRLVLDVDHHSLDSARSLKLPASPRISQTALDG